MKTWRKRILALMLSCALALPAGSWAAPTEGTGGETLTGEYVVIVNTDYDSTMTEPTGTIRFDSPLNAQTTELGMLSEEQPALLEEQPALSEEQPTTLLSEQ